MVYDLKEFRKKAKLTLSETANLTNLSVRYISMIENKERNPSDKVKLKLAEAYRIPASKIFLACVSTESSKQKGEE
ncbi:MAG: helix-turn-helix transcriptional regulator [Clostridiales bacterium]|nr:helix-turn-helix transcriptional regulator [Clostridiales bacterium]